MKLTIRFIKDYKVKEATREKHCRNSRKWRLENPEKVQRQAKQKKLSRDFHRLFKTENYYREKHTKRIYVKAQTAYKNSVLKAEEMNIPWNLSFKDFRFLVKFPCTFCGCKKDLIRLLERIDYTKGYEFDNVLPSCVKCTYLILYYKE